MSNYTEQDTIFVSIASYRDSMCSRTINSLFENAKRPQNIWVGLCEQNDKNNDDTCFSQKWKSHIRQIRIPHWDAKGPTWARYLCSSLIDGERYFLQIDSHSLFAKDWDLYLVETIKNLEKLGFKRAILSHYIRADKYYKEDNKSHYNSESKIPTICNAKFTDKGIISLNAAHDIDVKDSRPKPNAYIAGGMMFGKSEFIEQVPLDPNLPNLFVGEEILYSARLWTSGWDIFTPTKNVIYHYYIRESQPKFWNDNKEIDDQDAIDKVKYLLKLDKIDKSNINKHVSKNLDIYGLGKERTLEQYYEYIGLNLNNKTIDIDFCKTSIDDLYDKVKNNDNKSKKTIEKFSNTDTQQSNVNLLLMMILILFLGIIIMYRYKYTIKNNIKIKK